MQTASLGSFEHGVLGYILVTYRVHPGEAGQFGAECVELGVRSCADSVGEACDAISEATLLYFNSLERHSERERVFGAWGVAIIPGDPRDEVVEGSVSLRPSEYLHAETIRLPSSVA